MTGEEAEIRSAWMGKVRLEALVQMLMDERRAPAWQWSDYHRRAKAMYDKLDKEYGVRT